MEEFNREETYRFYVTKSLQIMPQNKYLSASYADLLNPKKMDTRSGDEIVADVVKRAGLKFRS